VRKNTKNAHGDHWQTGLNGKADTYCANPTKTRRRSRGIDDYEISAALANRRSPIRQGAHRLEAITVVVG
jgi:hypothetical protein